MKILTALVIICFSYSLIACGNDVLKYSVLKEVENSIDMKDVCTQNIRAEMIRSFVEYQEKKIKLYKDRFSSQEYNYMTIGKSNKIDMDKVMFIFHNKLDLGNISLKHIDILRLNNSLCFDPNMLTVLFFKDKNKKELVYSLLVQRENMKWFSGHYITPDFNYDQIEDFIKEHKKKQIYRFSNDISYMIVIEEKKHVLEKLVLQGKMRKGTKVKAIKEVVPRKKIEEKEILLILKKAKINYSPKSAAYEFKMRLKSRMNK